MGNTQSNHYTNCNVNYMKEKKEKKECSEQMSIDLSSSTESIAECQVPVLLELPDPNQDTSLPFIPSSHPIIFENGIRRTYELLAAVTVSALGITQYGLGGSFANTKSHSYSFQYILLFMGGLFLLLTLKLIQTTIKAFPTRALSNFLLLLSTVAIPLNEIDSSAIGNNIAGIMNGVVIVYHILTLIFHITPHTLHRHIFFVYRFCTVCAFCDRYLRPFRMYHFIHHIRRNPSIKSVKVLSHDIATTKSQIYFDGNAAPLEDYKVAQLVMIARFVSTGQQNAMTFNTEHPQLFTHQKMVKRFIFEWQSPIFCLCAVPPSLTCIRCC